MNGQQAIEGSSEAHRVFGLRGNRMLNPERSANRRQETLHAAARVFIERGYHTAAVEDVARAMGVSKGVVYYYFRSKDEICAEAICVAIEGAIKRLEAVTDRNLPPAETLREAIGTHVEYNINLEEAGSYAMITREAKALSSESRARVLELQRAYALAFTDIVRRGACDGALARRDPSVTAMLILTAANYIADWYRPKGRLPKHDMVEHVAAQLVDGLLPEETRE